jgi:hypothetical protein
VTKLAHDQKLPIDQKVLTALQTRFLESREDSPDYWAAASAFINYRSFLAAVGFPNPSTLPNCQAIWAPKEPPPMKPGDIVGMGAVTFIQKDCIWPLDNPQPISDTTFIHCWIVYYGGEVKIRNVHFENCLFEFRLQKPPSPSGISLERALLASNLNNVSFSSPGN